MPQLAALASENPRVFQRQAGREVPSETGYIDDSHPLLSMEMQDQGLVAERYKIKKMFNFNKPYPNDLGCLIIPHSIIS